MTQTSHFKEFEELFQRGEYQLALDGINNSDYTDYELRDHLEIMILKSRILEKLGKLDDALTIANDTLKRCKNHDDVLLIGKASVAKGSLLSSLGQYEEGFTTLDDALTDITYVLEQKNWPEEKDEVYEFRSTKAKLINVKGLIYWKKGELETAFDYYQQSLKIKKELGDETGIASSFNYIGNLYWSKGELETALDYYQQSLAIRKEVGNKQDIALSLNNIGIIYNLKGELETALDYNQQSLALLKELGNKQDIAASLNNIGNIYWRKGELETTLDYYQQSLAIRKEVGNKLDIALSLINIGNISWSKGELETALDYYQQSLALLKKLGIKQHIALSLNNIGIIYTNKGELETGLDYFQQSLALRKELGNKQDIAASLRNIGDIYRNKSELKIAIDYFQQSLAIRKEVGDPIDIAESLFQMIRGHLTLSNLNQAQSSLHELEILTKTNDNKRISLQYRLAKALVLKQSSRLAQKAKAQELLQTLVNEEIVDHELTILAIQSLNEILLFELKTTEDESLLVEIQQWIEKLCALAQKEHLFGVLIDSYILKAKMLLITGEITQAQQLLDQALITAEEIGLTGHKQKIEQEQQKLKSQLTSWKEMFARNASIFERLEISEMENYLKSVINIVEKFS
ncbi:MAG: tetratricopeptide repeat protein [Candidatus Hodarchaeales archaeon]|jgi:tetratricopeptide (TPR) repeat protein